MLVAAIAAVASAAVAVAAAPTVVAVVRSVIGKMQSNHHVRYVPLTSLR
jgi:hypothetical protein